jgi:predicted transcriptional regulator of viral defense system
MEKQTQANQLEHLFQQHNGLLTRQTATAAGFDPHLLSQFVREGRAERLQRGLYRLNTANSLEHEQLLEVQLRIPYGVICLTSALAFHGLTDHIPKQIDLAVPRKRKPPQLEYPPVHIHYLSDAVYAYGIEEHSIGSHLIKEGSIKEDPIEKSSVGQHSLRVYSAEKTLADLLHHAPRYGMDLFLEGLKTYLRQRQRNVWALQEAARVCRVERKLNAILEVLLET